MKLRLPLFLLSFILSIPAAMPAAADVIGAGVFYDVGKYSFSSDGTAKMPEGSQLTSDEWYCWAAAGANTVQYWQNFYYEQRDADVEVPNGIAKSGVYSQPAGTTYISVYQEALKKGVTDDTGTPEEFYNWWVKGTEVGSDETVVEGKDPYYGTLFDQKPVTQSLYETETVSLEDLTHFIKTALDTQGQAVSLTIGGTAHHAISCWGYELDPKTKMLSSLLLSCSDDQRFSVFRVDVEERECYIDYRGVVMEFGKQVSLVTDEMAGYYGHDWTWITDASALQTPADTPVDGAAPELETDINDEHEVKTNTSLSDAKGIVGKGIVIGDLDTNGNAKNVVVLTSTSSLSLVGSETDQKNEGTGLMIEDGGTVSLNGLSVEKYAKGGVDATGRLYVHNGDVKIANNETSDDGGGINNTSYVEIQNAGKVSFTGNTAEGKGGAISNVNNKEVPEDIDRLHNWVRGQAYVSEPDVRNPNYTTVSIRGNKEVLFTGNSATGGGNDIYNGKSSVVNIADNDKVRFEGENKSVAVLNEGYLFLSAEEGKSIDFVDSTLRSVGETAIGMDVSGRTTNADGTVNFTDATGKKELSLSSRHGLGRMIEYEDEWFGPMVKREYTIPALLQNVSVNADVIMGLGATPDKSSVTDTLIRTNNPLAISKLTMNTSDSIVSTSLGDVALDTVVFDLRQAQRTESGVVDLTSMLTGNYTFANVEFLMGDLTEDELKNLTFDISSAYNDAEKTLGIVLRSSKEATQPVTLNRNNVIFAFERVPEPTTGTLSLLALAALAARRRRKG